MHASQLVQMAAIVAQHGPLIAEGADEISPDDIQRYWSASKCRIDRWMSALRSARSPKNVLDSKETARRRSDIVALLEEILLSEPLTRVWAIVARAYDQNHQHDEAEPIARSVLLGQMEARNRLLQLLVKGDALSAEHSIALNRLRRRVERWTDLLVGYLAPLDSSCEMAFDRNRASDFSEDVCCTPKQQQVAWSLALDSLQSSLGSRLRSVSPNGDLNEKIVSSVLATFGSGIFDSTGLPSSLWQLRLATVASDTQSYIEDLLALDDEPSFSH